MDLRNFYRKIDMDNIKTKLPPMPQMKLPKVKSRKIFKSSREDISSSTPKHQQQQQQQASLRPRQIPPSPFVDHTPTRISTISSLMNIDEASGSNIGGRYGRGSYNYSYDEGFNSPRSYHGVSTYRSARSMEEEDDYGSPSTRGFSTLRRQATIELDKAETGGIGGTTSPSGSTKMTFSEKCMKHCKDLSSFKLKHLFAKKTVVRRTEIEVNHYAQRYEEERLEEEQRRREHIELENMSDSDYSFDFKMARRRLSCNSGSISPPDSLASGVPSPVRSEVARLQGLSTPPTKAPKVKRKNAPSIPQSGSESGKDTATPERKVFKGARASVRRSGILEKTFDETEDIYSTSKPNRSTLWSIKENVTSVCSTNQQSKDTDGEQQHAKKSYKQSIHRLKTMMSRDATVESGPESNPESAWKPPKMHRTRAVMNSQKSIDEGTDEEKKVLPNEGRGWNLKSLSRRHAETKTDTAELPADAEQPDSRLSAIKAGIKRFKTNNQTKRQSASMDETDEERTSPPSAKATSASKSIAARLRRFKSREASMNEIDSPPGRADDVDEKPDLAKKLHNWKKSFKSKAAPQNETSLGTGDEASPEKRRGTLIKKLKYIRSRKSPKKEASEVSNDDNDGEENAQIKKPSKLGNAREKAIKRVNAQMQKMRFFQKSTQGEENENENDDDDEDNSRNEARANKNITNISRSQGFHRNYAIDADEDYYNQQMLQQLPQLPKTSRTLWTTNKILSESLESDDLPELPRVLIHQDNSDCFESTLIIAVTRAAPPAPSPIITELPSNDSDDDEKYSPPQRTMASSSRYLNMAPMTVDSRQGFISHNRKRSLDSNDSDSWIPNNFRNKSCNKNIEMASPHSSSAVGLDTIDETNKPWKVHTMFSEKILYKTKSVDIFVENDNCEVFADFDDELKNVPIMRVIANSADSFEKSFGESTDDDDNDDNVSRITKIMVKSPQPPPPPSKMTCHDKADSEDSTEACHGSPTLKQEQQYNDSQIKRSISHESLDANYDENEEEADISDRPMSGPDDDDDVDDDDEDDDDDRPPSAAPSPPPSFSPPPPPLPLRRPSGVILSSQSLPLTSAPKVPERNESMVRLKKPLVKQASLRRNFNEEMQPGDFGKVNKLISRFEQPPPTALRHRRMRAADEDDNDDDDDSSSDYDDEDKEQLGDRRESIEDRRKMKNYEAKIEKDGEITPIQGSSRAASIDDNSTTVNVVPKKRMAPIPVPSNNNRCRQPTPTVVVTSTQISRTETALTTTEEHHSNNNNNGENSNKNKNNNNNNNISKDDTTIPILIPLATLDLESNSSRSQPSSEYGSPLGYPASLRGSACTTPTPSDNISYSKHVRDISRRLSNRSSLRGDDDTFYSFESDEENNFYSFGEASSTGGRQVIEI